MMLTIYGLPSQTNFKKLKALINEQCHIVDFILDSLMDDGPNSKKVKIGVSDDNEGYQLIKVLDGFRMMGPHHKIHILKVVPVGKPINPAQGFEQNNQGFGYQNEPQNFTNQPQLGFNQPKDFGSGGQGDMRHSGGNINYGGSNHPSDYRNSRPNLLPVGQGPNIGMQGSQGPLDRQWGSNTSAPGNQWVAPTQNQGNFQTPQSGFGHQGPSQYLPGQPDNAPYNAQGSIPVWNEQGQPKQFDSQLLPDKTRADFDKSGHFSSRFDSGKSYPSSGRQFDSSGRHSPSGRHGMPVREFSPSGRRISPSARRISPSGRRVSPSGRRVSPPGRKFSPPGRKFSPPGRKFSPPGRKFSPPGRKFSPPGRKYSPGRRMSPSDRRDGPRMSPGEARRLGRRDSPKRSPTRRLVSPARYREGHHEKTDDKMMKAIRPAYEPTQAQNQGYTGAYRGNDRDSAHYSGREPRSDPWQSEKTYTMQKEDLRNEIIRRSEAADQSRGRSRSPVRRERSPLKDRYRRMSPSSRSPHSPRRSWALEKRASPPAPPPPMWPEGPPKRASRFDVPPTHTPVWERPERTEEDRRRIEEKLRVRTDLGDKMSQQAANRREYEERREFRLEPNIKKSDVDRNQKQFEERRNFRPEPVSKKFDIDRDYQRKDDRVDSSRGREGSERSDKTVLAEIDKDFHDIYKRAVEFRKKAEEMRKSGDRRRDDYDARQNEADKKYRRESPPTERSRERHEPNKMDGFPSLPERKRASLSKAAKVKRNKAVEEISERILKKYDMNPQHRCRILEELKLMLTGIFIEMFQDNDISFIELVVKYRARYDAKAEEKLLQKVLHQLPTKYRDIKRKSEGDDNAVNTLHFSPPQDARKETVRPKLADAVVPGWNIGLEPPKVLELPLTGLAALGAALRQPAMVPPPAVFAAPLNMTQQTVFQQMPHSSLSHQPVFQPPVQGDMSQALMQSNAATSFAPPDAEPECHNLYLCQDDFESFSDLQADYLKNFLINQMIKVSESGRGWAPDFTLKGLQGMYRYEVSTTDEASKNWLIDLDFSEFEYFNVLVYTKEELWYERAAIWLPGHSRVRNIEPLDKLRMQNSHLVSVNLDKWKFVKKIVTAKGTRLYVDMPPSSARALENHRMMLSYELQKVTVFLKALAVDKDSFDVGLKEVSITNTSVLIEAVKNAVMPTLNATEPGLVKLGLNGLKSINVNQARKIKDVLIYNLFKYYEQNNGTGKTDFTKHGYCTPGFFAVLPENNESKRWLYSRQFGRINRHPIVVFGSDDDNTKYFKMLAFIPHEYQASAHLAFERLKQSNQGVKGIHFNLWKPVNIKIERKRAVLEVEVDLESVEVIIKMKYKLDYVGEYGIQSVDFKSEYALSKLEEKVKTYKMEQVDSYDVAKMDIDSEDSDDDVLCLG